MRRILHVDLDAFYSAVEQLDRPELRGKPVVVGGDAEGRGVVCTASYEARKFGIGSAMPCRTAKRLCPDAIFVRPRFDRYREASDVVMAILAKHSPQLEPLSMDEAFVDISDSLRMADDGRPAAAEIKSQINEATGLTASIGVAGNKVTAKVASDYEKPDGLTVVPVGRDREFLAPLPVRKLWGIGPRTEERLREVGITHVHELAAADEGWLRIRFGASGLDWQCLARGIDDRPVKTSTERKQISRETTLSKDEADGASLKETLTQLAEEVQASLARHRPARTLTIKIRYADFATVTRSLTPGTVVKVSEVSGLSQRLFDEHWNGKAVRLLGVSASNFLPEQGSQLSLL